MELQTGCPTLDAEGWALVDRVAVRFAYDRGRRRDADEFVAEAHYRVLVELQKHPDLEAAPARLACVVRRRLTDWWRSEGNSVHGRIRRPHDCTVELHPNIPAPEPGPDESRVRAWLYSLCKQHAPQRDARCAPLDAWSLLIDSLIDGDKYSVLALEWGVSESRIAHMVGDLRRWAREHRDEWDAT